MLDRRAIEQQLVELKKSRDIIDSTIQLLEGELSVRTAYKVAEGGKLYTGAKSEDLKPYIQEWVDQGHTLLALADRAGLSEETLRRVLTGHYSMVRNTTADKIITALNITHRYNDIVPLPPESKYWED